jgi:hypothetical protein
VTLVTFFLVEFNPRGPIRLTRGCRYGWSPDAGGNRLVVMAVKGGLAEEIRMNRATIERRLQEAEQHIARGGERITRQHEIIATLERDGRNTRGAKELLVILEETQHQHIATRERILDELQSS